MDFSVIVNRDLSQTPSSMANSVAADETALMPSH